jgi:hypothetical protein
MLRASVAACCLFLAGCYQTRAPMPSASQFTALEPAPTCDAEKARSIAREYIPKITSPNTPPLAAEMALKSMKAQFIGMTVGMDYYPMRLCWARIELELDLARIEAAKARREPNSSPGPVRTLPQAQPPAAPI